MDGCCSFDSPGCNKLVRMLKLEKTTTIDITDNGRLYVQKNPGRGGAQGTFITPFLGGF